MNLRSLVGTLGMAAIVASTCAMASAQTPYNYQNPNQYNYRTNSLADVGRIGNGVSHLINRLNRDTRDYGGHRAAAVGNLQNAQNELGAAAQFAEAHGYQMPPLPQPRAGYRQPNPYQGMNRQQRSDWSIERSQQQVSHWLQRLSRDSRDFGGHRVAAINWLQRAQSELGMAIQYAQSHGY